MEVWAKLWINQSRLHGRGTNQFGFHWMTRIPTSRLEELKVWEQLSPEVGEPYWVGVSPVWVGDRGMG